MTINWRIWAPLGIVAIVALIIIGFYQPEPKMPTAPVIGETPQAPVAIPQASGNVDTAVDAILVGVSDDQALFADAEKDAELITADSQTISDFGQSYDENEF